MAHLIENILIDQYLNAIKVTVDEKEVDSVINELKAELTMVKKDYVKELEAMMLTEAEFRVEVSAQIHGLPGYQPIPTAEKCHDFLSRALQAAT